MSFKRLNLRRRLSLYDMQKYLFLITVAARSVMAFWFQHMQDRTDDPKHDTEGDCRPKTGDIKSRHYLAGQQNQQSINDDREESDGKYVYCGYFDGTIIALNPNL